MDNTKNFTFRAEETILLKLKYISKENKRSMNSELELIVESYIMEYEKNNGKIPIEEE